MTQWFNEQWPVWLDRLSQMSLWWQVLAVLACVLLAWFIRTRYVAWLREYLKEAKPSRLRQVALSASRHLVLPATLCLLLLVGWGVFRGLALPLALIWVALSLAFALLLIRLVVYLLERALKPGPLLRASENFIVIAVWIGVALYLLGWLPLIVEALDRAAFTVGETRFSLLAILKVALMVVVVLLLALWLSRLVERTVMSSRYLSASLKIGISKVVRLVFLVLGLVVAMQLAGLNLSTLTVVGGALGLGIGLGLQSIVSNFISGFILLADRSVKPGDVITVEDQSGSRYGWVQELRARYTVIRDRDGVDTLVPNENLIINPVINWSYGGNSIRLKLPVQISYDDDPEQAMELLLQCAANRERVLDDPKPAARLMGFGESGIDLELRVWSTDPEKGVNGVRSDINLAIWKAFKAHGITMPFPQRDLRIIQSDGMHSAVQGGEST